MADFGYREGFAQMGSYRLSQGGLGFIYARRGQEDAPDSGTVAAWIAANGPWTDVRMISGYEPSYVARFPVRAAVEGGVACIFPSIEADALVEAGVASVA